MEWEFVDLPSLLVPELLEAVGLPTALGLHLEGRCLRASVAQRDVAGVLEAVEEALQAVTTNEEEQSEPEPVDPSLLRSTGAAAGQDIYERDLAAFLARNRRRKRP